METINGLIEFIYVAENNSFSAAAKALKVSKSHISKQVTKLENTLQVSLLIRTTRKMTLTDSGKLLYERSKHIFNDLDEIFSEVTKQQNELTGSLKISVAGAFAEEHLAKCFASFLQLNNKLKLEIIFTERFVNLIEENFDLAIRYGQLESSTLISKKIASRQEFICASPKYLEINGIPSLPKDLSKHHCLVGNNDTWSFNKNQKIKVSGPWKSNNGRALSIAVKEGLGIAKLPGVYVYDSIKKGELIPLLSSYTKKEQDIWVVYPQKRHLPQRTRELIDFLSDFLNKNYNDAIF